MKHILKIWQAVLAAVPLLSVFAAVAGSGVATASGTSVTASGAAQDTASGTAPTAVVPSAADDAREPSKSENVVRRGYALVPPGVVLNLHGKDRQLVGLGSYIVNTSACVDCHSYPTYSPGGDPFRGEPERLNAEEYLSGGRQFGPATTAPNITPDRSGKPAGLTRREFIQVLRTGHNPKDPPGSILQVMPWPAYGKKTELELAAMYEYLRAIPALPDNTHPGP